MPPAVYAAGGIFYDVTIVMERKLTRVVTGMSGGVDSSVAAALLVERGFDVVGITIKTYQYEDVGGNVANDTSCCSLDGINDARRTAAQLGSAHYVVDFTVPFKERVIDYFIDGYMQGTTPNPCVQCNRHIKWRQMIQKADALGAEYIATGHYARLSQDRISGRFFISRAADMHKDQSYALWNVAQEDLARTIFPLGEMTKSQVRETAVRFGLDIAAKKESYEICFIPDNDYARFLRENVSGLESKVTGGAIQYKGNKIGEHDGYPFYTIGQRRGLNVSVGTPVFVTNIDRETNTLILDDESALLHRGLRASQTNFMKYASLEMPMKVSAKIRYKDEGAPAIVKQTSENSFELIFEEPRRAITPGQSVVLYEGNDIVAGGIITEWF